MDMRIPPLRFKLMLESSPLKSIMLVGKLAVSAHFQVRSLPGKSAHPRERERGTESARDRAASTEVTFGRGDLSVCPLGGFVGAPEWFISNRRGVPQACPQGQALRALCVKQVILYLSIYPYIYLSIYIYLYIYTYNVNSYHIYIYIYKHTSP